jgi:hypothetical protein
MTFDEFKKEFGVDESQYSAEHYIIGSAFKAGVASRQAEIDALQEVINREREQATEYYTDFHCVISERDALQKRIDGVVRSLEGVKVTGLRPHCYDYDKGWRDCAITTLNDLKGDKND